MFIQTVYQCVLAVINSYRQIIVDWDQVKDVSKFMSYQGNNQGLHRHYFYPYSSVLFVFFDCLYIWAENGFHYSYTEMPRFLFHYTFPREFWQQGDILLTLALSMAVLIYPLLMMDPMLDQKYVMYLSLDRKTTKASIRTNNEALNAVEAEKIVRFRSQMRFLFPILVISIWLPVELFYMWNFFQKWTNSLRDYVMSAVTIVFMLSICISNIFMSFFFVMTATYYQIRQKCKIERLRSLSHVINKKSLKATIKQSNSALTLQFRNLNQEVLNLYREIPVQNHFWSRYMTLYFLVYIFAIVYLAYCFFFVKTSLDGLKKSFFLFFANNFMVILVIITLECTRVVRNNLQLHRQCITLTRFEKKFVSKNEFGIVGKLRAKEKR